MTIKAENQISYVYEDREVIPTGRLASPNGNPKLKQLIEIVPFGTDPTDKSYARWVKLEDLLVISDLGDYEDD